MTAPRPRAASSSSSLSPSRASGPRAATAWRALTTTALALPAALLALGWFLASLRENGARRKEERRELAAGANAVVAAVREGLEELRAREDERPYYLYSYYYTPQDLIAVQESVAVSPLGRIPDDGRVRGHFQIDPGARVGTPLANDEASPLARQRGAEVIELVGSVVAPQLATLTHPPALMAPRASAAGVDALANPENNQIQNQTRYSSTVLADIRAAQSGESAASTRNAVRGRAPYRSRVNVGWYGPAPSSVESDPVVDNSRGTIGSNGATGADRAAPTSTFARDADGVGATPVARYTPMAFRRAGDLLFLYRVVTTDGAASVQGALLDAEGLRRRWLAAVARRHPLTGAVLTVTGTAAARSCPVAVALPPPLEDLAVCARSASARPDGSFAWQLLALCGVLALILASAVARERALRRAADLAGIERAFVASVSHELRTPLTTLRMHAEMLQEGWVAEERRARVIDQLVAESGRLSRLIEDVLTFGRLADGRAQLGLVDGDLSACVRAVAERERGRLEERGVALDLADLADEVTARFDPTAVDQVLTNLLDNAAKYAVGASEPVVRVAVAPREHGARIRVSDAGPGIPAAERERVFERFYRGRDAMASHVAGTGLGLAIVRGLARAMGGDARVVANAPGAAGCAIEIELPAAAVAEA